MFYGPPGHGSPGASWLCPINIPSLLRAVIPINPILNTHTQTVTHTLVCARYEKHQEKNQDKPQPQNAFKCYSRCGKLIITHTLKICMSFIFMILMKYSRQYSHLYINTQNYVFVCLINDLCHLFLHF